jgi:eukaryotic-like serine/threonine-protein kinase
VSLTPTEPGPDCPSPAALEKYLREELPPEKASSVEEHLCHCPPCEQALRRLVGDLPVLFGPLPEEMEEFADEPLPGLNGYEPLNRIDAGGMGVVWRVRDLQFQRTLAVKVMRARACNDPNAVRRFLAEARITGQLAHPFIVPIHAMGRLPDNRPYYTMKLVEGKTLAELLRNRTDPASRRTELVQVFAQVCQAVAFAHSRGVTPGGSTAGAEPCCRAVAFAPNRGIIHRDLKPANIMVGAHGEVQVMDWGLAKVLAGTAAPPVDGEAGNETADDSRHEANDRTRTGSVLGTWAYMAPEQARGLVAEVDQRSDVFGLGAILCEILTGQPPFVGPDAKAIRLEVTEARLDGALSRLRGCGAEPELIQLAERCLAQRQSDRPADAGEVAAAVAAYQAAVQERIQQAERERAAAQARAQEAQATARAEAARAAEARAKARAERRARRLIGGLAAAGLLLVVGGGVAGWVVNQQWQERARQVGQTAQAANNALSQVRELRRHFLFEEARKLLDRTEGTLRGTGLDGVQEGIRRARDELEFVAELDTIRQQKAQIVGGKLDATGAPPQYKRAFAKRGLDFEQGNAAELARTVAGAEIKENLVAALDDWAALEPNDELLKRLREVTRLADRGALRDALRDHEGRALIRLAQEQTVANHLPATLVVLGDELRRAGGDTVKLWRRAQQEHPQDFWLNFLLGNEVVADSPAEAAGYFRAALAVRRNSASAWNNLGYALEKQGQLDEAMAAFEKAVAIEPLDDGAWNNLGKVLWVLKEQDQAVAAYNRALAINPRNDDAWNGLGNALFDLARFDRKKLAEVAAVYNQALAINPRNDDAWNGLGTILRLQRKFADAVAAYKKSLEIDPRQAAAWNNLGYTLNDQKEWAKAADAFRKCMEIDQPDAEVWNGFGMALAGQGKWNDAADAYNKALELDPQYASAWNNLGTALHELRQEDKALAAYEKAVAIDPQFAHAWNNLGASLAERGKVDRAVSAFQKAVVIDPQYAQAWFNLSLALVDQGKVDEAIAAYQKAVAIEPEFTTGWIDYAVELAENEKRYLGAVCYFSAAFAAQPQLIKDGNNTRRYHAARAASLAAAGQGKDAGGIGVEERAKLRRQALDWLRDDLKVWSRYLVGNDPQQRDLARITLQHWKGNPDFAGLRCPDAVTMLPPPEREAWLRFWAEVDELLEKAQDKK